MAKEQEETRKSEAGFFCPAYVGLRCVLLIMVLEGHYWFEATSNRSLNILTFASPSLAFFETEMQTLLTQIISQDLSAHKYIREFEHLYKKKFYNEKSGSHFLQLIKNIWKLSNRNELGKIHKIAQKPVEFENQLNMLQLNKRVKDSRDSGGKVRLPLVF